MALMTAYLGTSKNIESFFNSLTTAKAPDVFTLKFLEGLEFKSSNDRLFIGVLKGLGFLDTNGVPTKRYFEFLDQSKSKVVLADAIKEAYEDLFAVNLKANELEVADVRNKLKTLTQGKFSENVYKLMALTFKGLVDYSEWKPIAVKKDTPGEKNEKPKPIVKPLETALEPDETRDTDFKSPIDTQLHYNIQIHLPETRDPAIYDALFKSLKKHLF